MAQYPELKGRVALVTGGARGIGAAISRAFGAQGCRVAINDIEATDAAAQVCNEIAKLGGNAKIFLADVSEDQPTRAMIDEVRSAFGTVDILVNNAGINRDHVIWKMTE